MNVLPHVDGSALFELGNTRILCTVHGPREPRQRSITLHDRCSITVRFHAATFSSVSGERRRQVPRDRRLEEWSRYLEEVFSTAILISQFPRSQIEINIEVLNADGGVLAAAINSTTLALITAGIPLQDYVIACRVGYLGKTVLLDTNSMEEGGGGAFPGLTMASYGRKPHRVLLMTEDGKVGGDQLENMTELAKLGITRLFQLLEQTIVVPIINDMLSSSSRDGAKFMMMSVNE